MATEDDRWRRETADWQTDVRDAGLDPAKFDMKLCRSSIPAHRFDRGSQRWSPYYVGTVQHRGGKDLPRVTVSSLRVVTWNLFFSTSFWEVRLARVLDEARAERPDLICLQEATALTLTAILADPWIREHYLCSDGGDSGTLLPYGVVVLSRVPVVKFVIFDMMSRMNRKFLLAELNVCGELVVCASVHLESMPSSSPIRLAQLKLIHGALRPYERLASLVLLVGDMNIHDVWEAEDSALVGSYVDLWPSLRPEDRGYTQNSELNIMTARLKQTLFLVRYDRVLAYFNEDLWRPTSINLLGTESLHGLGDVFPSDHFGLVATVGWMPAARLCSWLCAGLPWGPVPPRRRDDDWESIVTLPRKDERSDDDSTSAGGGRCCRRRERRPATPPRGRSPTPTSRGASASPLPWGVHRAGNAVSSTSVSTSCLESEAGSSVALPPRRRLDFSDSSASDRRRARPTSGAAGGGGSRGSRAAGRGKAPRGAYSSSTSSALSDFESETGDATPGRVRTKSVGFASDLEARYSDSAGGAWSSSGSGGSGGTAATAASEYRVDYVGFNSEYAAERVPLESVYGTDVIAGRGRDGEDGGYGTALAGAKKKKKGKSKGGKSKGKAGSSSKSKGKGKKSKPKQAE